MTTVFQQQTLASGTGNQTLLAQRQQLYNLEAAQAEGTQMEFLLTVSPAAGSVVSAIAQINDAAKRHGVLTWPGETDLAFPSGNNQVALRWRRGQPWLLIVLGILAVTVVIWYYLQGWRLNKGQFVNINTGQTETPQQFLSSQLPAALTNPAVYLVGGVLLFGGIFIWHKAQMETSTVVRTAKYQARAKRIRDRSKG